MNARHAAPRPPVGRRALLPTVLLLAATSAFGGLAVLPAPADAGTATGPSGAAPAGSSLPPQALSLSEAVAGGLDRGHDEAEVAAVLRSRERASRSRVRPPAPAAAAVAVPAAPPAAAAPKPPPPAAAPAAAAPKPPPKPAPPVAAKPKPEPPETVRPGVGRLTSKYGPRWGRLHAGIDLASGIGSPISAVAAGTVLSAGDEGGYGRCVRVQHPDGTVSLYAHMSEILVAPGQAVAAGTHLGREGNSGHSTGPHLHFEIRVNGTPIDPMPWLRARGIDPAR